MIPHLITPDNVNHFRALFPQENLIEVGKVIWIGHYYCRFTKPGQQLAKLNTNTSR